MTRNVNNPMDLCYIVDGIPARQSRPSKTLPRSSNVSPRSFSTAKDTVSSTAVNVSDTERPLSEVSNTLPQPTKGKPVHEEQIPPGSKNKVHDSKEYKSIILPAQVCTASRGVDFGALKAPLVGTTQQTTENVKSSTPKSDSRTDKQSQAPSAPSLPFSSSMAQVGSPETAVGSNQGNPYWHTLRHQRSLEAHSNSVPDGFTINPHQRLAMYPGTAVSGPPSFVFPPPVPIAVPPPPPPPPPMPYAHTQGMSRIPATADNMVRMPAASAKCSPQAVGERVLVLEKNISPPETVTTKTRQYGCERCGRSFYRRSDLARHIQIHLGIKPNLCTYCGKAFIQRSALTVHLRVHTGEKPYSCKVCGRLFSDSSSLARHRRIHQRQLVQQGDPGAGPQQPLHNTYVGPKNNLALRLTPATTFDIRTSVGSSPTSASTAGPPTPDTIEIDTNSRKIFN